MKVEVNKDFLKNNALFGGLIDDELNMIAELIEVEMYQKGDYILKEGEQGKAIYFIYNGSVEVVKHGKSGDNEDDEVLAILKSGDTFGEMEVIEIKANAASIRAREISQVLVLSIESIFRIKRWNFKTFTMILYNLARELSRRLRKMDKYIASMMCKDKKHSIEEYDD